MDNQNIISNELLEAIFYSMGDDNNFDNVVKNMYNFFRENSYSNNLIHIELLQFFGDRRDYIQEKYNVNYNQLKVLLNKVINENVNQIVTEVLDSSDENQENDNLGNDSNDSNDTEVVDEAEEEIDIQINYNETPVVQTYEQQQQQQHPHQQQQAPQPQNQLPMYFNLFNNLFNAPGNPVIYDPLFNIEFNNQIYQNPQNMFYQPQQNLFNLFNNFLPENFDPTNIFLNQTGNIINDLYLNSTGANLSNSQIDSLNNIIPNLGNIYSVIHTRAMNGDLDDTIEINIDVPFGTVTSTNSRTKTRDVINEKELQELKIVEYKNLENKEKYEECSICLNEYTDESKLRLLKCEHGFHPECVDQWLKEYKYNCPVCRDNRKN